MLSAHAGRCRCAVCGQQFGESSLLQAHLRAHGCSTRCDDDDACGMTLGDDDAHCYMAAAERGAGVTLTDSVTVDSVLTADTDDIGLCSFVV